MAGAGHSSSVRCPNTVIDPPRSSPSLVTGNIVQLSSVPRGAVSSISIGVFIFHYINLVFFIVILTFIIATKGSEDRLPWRLSGK